MVELYVNYINIFYIGLYINDESHIKYAYIIGWEHNHVVLSDHTNLSPIDCAFSAAYLIVYF